MKIGNNGFAVGWVGVGFGAGDWVVVAFAVMVFKIGKVRLSCCCIGTANGITKRSKMRK